MNIGVVIGRFQPFHNGHAHLITEAMKNSDQLIVVLGSSNRHRSIKNPFTVPERKSMIRAWFRTTGYSINQLSFVEAPDNLYKEWTWKANIIRGVSFHIPFGVDANVTLYGHEKDDSSYYLKQFPEWNFINVSSYHEIDATGIRKTYFESGVVPKWPLPDYIRRSLIEFTETQAYKDLIDDWKFYETEKVIFGDYPYKETLNFMCSDAIVICSANVLMIKRKHAPGKNSWALPGGFKNASETFEDAAIRELKEETNLRIPEKVLRGSLESAHMFDHPNRNLGVTRVSMGFYFEVDTNPDGTLPSLRPASDAFEARWIPLSDAMAMNLFDDHNDILEWFL